MGGLNLHAKHASHLPALVDALRYTEGPVVELGTGVCSTFALHWLCWHQGRRLVSYESDPAFFELVVHCHRPPEHEVWLVEDWDEAELEQPWAVAFVDHAPAARRKVDVARLARWAEAIVVHDVQWQLAHHYEYGDLLDSFAHRRDYRMDRRVTAMLSNTMEVEGWI